jgi:hypothetical protein
MAAPWATVLVDAARCGAAWNMASILEGSGVPEVDRKAATDPMAVLAVYGTEKGPM